MVASLTVCLCCLSFPPSTHHRCMHRKVVARNISRAVLRAMVYVCVCSVCVCVCVFKPRSDRKPHDQRSVRWRIPACLAEHCGDQDRYHLGCKVDADCPPRRGVAAVTTEQWSGKLPSLGPSVSLSAHCPVTTQPRLRVHCSLCINACLSVCRAGEVVRWGSNPRPFHHESGVLPLSHIPPPLNILLTMGPLLWSVNTASSVGLFALSAW